MKVRKLSTIIFKLKVLNLLYSEITIFSITLSIFLVLDVCLFGISVLPFLLNLLAHYIVYTHKIKDIYIEILPEKQKIEDVINILKKRKKERQ
jgi:hypothetical protein